MVHILGSRERELYPEVRGAIGDEIAKYGNTGMIRRDSWYC